MASTIPTTHTTADNAQSTSAHGIPTTTVMASTSAQQKLDLLLQEEHDFDFSETRTARSIASEPPAYSADEMTTAPVYPSRAHISRVHTPLSSTPITAADLPTYDHATVDMPPGYTHQKVIGPDSPFDMIPVETQMPWPITKKLYIAGFFLWPLWFIGMGFSMFGKEANTRRWGRRCAWNSLAVFFIFTYLVMAYNRTNGRWTS